MNPMDKPCKGWSDYWNQDDLWKNSQLLKVNAELLFSRMNRIIEFRKTDSVLDIGCGPGHLEVLMAPAVKNIHAVDIAEQFVDLCKERCRNYDNVSAGLLGCDFTNLTLPGKSFSLIICAGVTQYYSDIGEIEALINSARKIALSGAKMLIADLPLKRGKIGFVWDALCSCLLSVRKGYMWPLVRTAFIMWLCNSGYKSFCKQIKQLHFTISDLESLIQRMGLKAKIARENFSVYANRPSLLIWF